MTGRIKVKELMQREDLEGEVVNLFPPWHTGIIHGDDGYDVAFNEESLVVGFSYGGSNIPRNRFCRAGNS